MKKVNLPEELVKDGGVFDVAAARNHTLAVSARHKQLFSWGARSWYQLGMIANYCTLCSCPYIIYLHIV